MAAAQPRVSSANLIYKYERLSGLLVLCFSMGLKLTVEMGNGLLWCTLGITELKRDITNLHTPPRIHIHCLGDLRLQGETVVSD